MDVMDTLVIVGGLLLVLFAAAWLTNPFRRLTVVRRSYTARLEQDAIRTVNQNHKIRVRNAPWWRGFAWAKQGVHVLESRYLSSPRSGGKTVPAIIRDIHRLRYDPSKLLLISGDHFSPLFVRNLGVFYYPMLDDRIVSGKQDWHNRQLIYLQTVAWALGVYHRSPRLTTTIVSTSRYGATCINFYAYPSDTLYGMLYALAVLSGKERPRPCNYGSAQHKLNSQAAAKVLLNEYRQTLQRLYAQYRQTVYDEQTGLIKQDLHLSGAKDITRRYCAFYDNVIFWKTTQLAMQLGLIEQDKAFLAELKRRILKTFWLPKAKYFLEDLSDEGVKRQYYSSDWLVVLFTGFLDPAKQSEQPYFLGCLDYIERHGIAKPFAIKYQQDRRAHRQFAAVRLAVASYGGDSIWSFWGMEYIKLLLALHKSTGDSVYLQQADQHIAQYKRAMLRDGGFPEVYDQHGRMLKTPLYRSIRQTGWVIGFEQVLAMRAAVTSAA